MTKKVNTVGVSLGVAVEELLQYLQPAIWWRKNEVYQLSLVRSALYNSVEGWTRCNGRLKRSSLMNPVCFH